MYEYKLGTGYDLVRQLFAVGEFWILNQKLITLSSICREEMSLEDTYVMVPVIE